MGMISPVAVNQNNVTPPSAPAPPSVPAPGQTTPPPVSFADGGILGQAALGALSGAEKAQNSYLDENGNPISSAPVYLDTNGNPITSSPKEAQAGVFPVTPGTEEFLEGVNKALPFRKDINTATQDAINMIRLGYDKLTGSGQNVGLSDILAAGKTTEEGAEARENPSAARSAGDVAGNIAQFIAGDEALKALSLGEKLDIAAKITKILGLSPKMAKALDIGVSVLQNVTRQGAVAGAMTLGQGGTPGQAAENAATTGVVGGALEAIPLGMKAVYNSIVKTSPEAIASAKEAAIQEGTRLAEEIAGKDVSSQAQTTEDVINQLTKARGQMSADYDQGIYEVGNQVKAVGGILVDTAGSPVEATAKSLLSNSDLPVEMEKAMKGLIPDAARLDPVLEELSSGKKYTWDEMEAIRKQVGTVIRNLPYDSPLTSGLAAIRDSIDDTLENAAEKAGKPELANEMSDIRKTYAIQKRAFEASVIKNLSTKNPDAVAKLLLNKSDTLFRVDVLRQLIGEQNMHAVEGSILKNLIDDSSKTAGEGTLSEFMPKDFIKRFNNLGSDVQEAIWGDNLPKVKNFLQVAANVPKANPIWKGLGAYMEHRALFDVALSAGGLWAGEKFNRLLPSAAILTGVLMLHNPALLDYATKALEGAAKVATPTVAGGIVSTNSSLAQPQQQSENMPVLPEGYSHVKTSGGNEFYIPNAHIEDAKRIDAGLQLLKQSGQPQG